MDLEIHTLKRNETWKMVPPPIHFKLVGCNLGLSIKLKSCSTVERHIARLVAKGFNTTFGVDYFNTFSLVVKLTIVRIVLTLVVTLYSPIRQLDVNNAFLNDDLNIVVFIE